MENGRGTGKTGQGRQGNGHSGSPERHIMGAHSKEVAVGWRKLVKFEGYLICISVIGVEEEVDRK